MTQGRKAAASRINPARPAAKPWRIAYLVTHPIQYQAPLLRLIAAQPDMDLTVFFQSEGSLGEHFDAGFGEIVRWDVPLLDGYRHEFLPAIGRRDLITAHRPFSYGIASRLLRGGFDVLWVHGYSRPFNWQAMLIAKLAGLKVFVRDDATLAGTCRRWSRRLAKQVFFRLLARIVDGFLAVGAANAGYYRAHGVRERQIFILPYAVDNDFFRVRARDAERDRERLRRSLGLEPGRPIILYASKFQARKRPLDLLHAYEQLLKRGKLREPPYLLYAGDGDLRAATEAEAVARSLAGVRFLGFRNQTELPPLFDLCDVFVLPSVNEPYGLVVNEVMAVGRAVVVTDEVGCAPDLVRPGINGFTFPAGDVAALADVLERTLSSPSRTQAMGNASCDIIGHWNFGKDIDGLRRALTATVPRPSAA
jgi:glycosyltransferase involved in cell wall biosynthesis